MIQDLQGERSKSGKKRIHGSYPDICDSVKFIYVYI